MLGANLTKYRELRGYSKLYLAKISGVSKETITQIELQENRGAQLGTIEKLAKALNIKSQDLVK